MSNSETQPLLKPQTTTTSSATIATTITSSSAKMGETKPTPAVVVPQDKTPAASSKKNQKAGAGGVGGKKKQPPFLEREVKILNPGNIDQKFLLEKMHKRYEDGYNRWRRRASIFKLANLLVTLFVVAVQVSQVVIFQISSIPTATKTSIATILPAVTGAILAVQLKLGWGEKAQKCKKSARLYNKLASHAEYRMTAAEAGAEFEDSIKIWNHGLVSECSEVPAFLLAY